MSDDQLDRTSTFRQAFSKFLCDSPLYTAFELSQDEDTEEAQIETIVYDELKIDMYCTWCRKSSIFSRKIHAYNYSNYIDHARKAEILLDDEYSVALHCSRDSDHVYKFSLVHSDHAIMKIGQVPSMETISGSDIEKYRSVLEREYFIELHKAGGLASHGMGIPPYVYLRRIFERLIFQHYEEHKTQNGEIANFETMRIEDKISALSHSLPKALLNNKAVYRILSKGIHELEEKTCLKYYPVVRAVIIAILEEDLVRKSKAKAERDLTNSLSKALSELSEDN